MQNRKTQMNNKESGMNQNQDQGEKKNKAGLVVGIVIGIILLMLIIGAIGAYFVYRYISDVTKVPDSSYLYQDTYDSNVQEKTNYFQDTGSWQTYNNVRFGFSIKYPENFDKFESENGDGITLSHPDAVSIKAYATNNYDNLTTSKYLDKEFSELLMDTPKVEEIGINEVNMDGCKGERRAWEYISPVDGVKTFYEKAACLKGNVFYVVEMIAADDGYMKYATTFDEVLFSFKFK